MKSYFLKASLPKNLPSKIVEKMDAFHEEESMNVFNGDNWYSFFYSDNTNYFFNVLAPTRFDCQKLNTSFLEINPFLGYGGPIFSGPDSFLEKALEEYSLCCSKLGIIIELIRFNPILRNHEWFLKKKNVPIISAKKIVILSLKNGEESQFKSYKPPCQRMIKAATKNCKFEKINKVQYWDKFVSFLRSGLMQNNADSKFMMSDSFFKKASLSDSFEGYGVFKNNELMSAALLLIGKTTNYYLMAANLKNHARGSMDLLIHQIALLSIFHRKKYLILGGGRTSSEDDLLLRFKRKFSEKSYDFYVGSLIHNKKFYKEIVSKTELVTPELKSKNYLLKHHFI